MYLQLSYNQSVSCSQNISLLCLFIYLLTREPFVQLKISSLIMTIIKLGQRNYEHRSPHACRPSACQLPSLCVLLLTWMLTVVSHGFLCLLLVLTKRWYAEVECASRCPTSTLTTRGHIFSWLESKWFIPTAMCRAGTFAKTQSQRDRQYNLRLSRVHATIVAVAGNKYYIFWGCVCTFRYPACGTRVPYRYLWPVRLCSICQHYLINCTIVGKKKEGKFWT